MLYKKYSCHSAIGTANYEAIEKLCLPVKQALGVKSITLYLTY